MEKELTLEILDEAISKIRETDSEWDTGFDVALLNSEDWKRCKQSVNKLIGTSYFTGYETIWGMRVIAIPEISEDTMILYSSPDHYKILKHIKKDT